MASSPEFVAQSARRKDRSRATEWKKVNGNGTAAPHPDDHNMNGAGANQRPRMNEGLKRYGPREEKKRGGSSNSLTSSPQVSSRYVALGGKEDVVSQLEEMATLDSDSRPEVLMAAPEAAVDEFGFFLEDKHDGSGAVGAVANKAARSNKAKAVQQRREEKWNQMLSDWELTVKRRKAKVKSRARKGVPMAVRGQAWVAIGNVPYQMYAEHRGLYDKLVKAAFQPAGSAADGSDQPYKMNVPLRDTIERDINRTYPRHSLFASPSDHEDDGYNGPVEDEPTEEMAPSSSAPSDSQPDPVSPQQPSPTPEDYDSDAVTGGLRNNCAPFEAGKKGPNGSISGVIDAAMAQCSGSLNDVGTPDRQTQKTLGSPALSNSGEVVALVNGSATPKPAVPSDKLAVLAGRPSPSVQGGQASLRRVLRAYSLYDPEVGYCQGMNFIAAMFIMNMSEEEAFWMLVSVMNSPPCKMRGLFGEGMSEAHMVLHIAERLIQQFLPKLAAHLEKENIQVTMFATQWLLTVYTSSFRFGLVTRVWDAFVVEGWKIVYRVMLGLLQMATPDLLNLRFEEILAYFRDLPSKIDDGAVLEASLKIPLRKKHIDKYQKEWLSRRRG